MTRPIIIEVDFGYLGLVTFFPQVSAYIPPPNPFQFKSNYPFISRNLTLSMTLKAF